MIQCKDCQFCKRSDDGQLIFTCDPFTTIVEPECLTKWQLLRLDGMTAYFRSLQGQQQKMAPMQDKIMRYVQRELDDIDQTDNWKYEEDDIPDETL